MTATAFSIQRPVRIGPRGRKAGLLAASLLIHAAVLGPLAWRYATFDPYPRPAPAERPIYIEIEPRALLDGERTRMPAVPAETLTDARPATATSAAVLTPRKRDEDDRPSTPAPRVIPGAPLTAEAPPAGAEDAWRVQPESLGGAVARTLRVGPVGCRMMDGRLSAAEQALCDERFNEAAGRAAPITGSDNPERDARFAREGARARAAYEARRAPLRGGVGVVGPADCVGSNFGTGCAGAHLSPEMQRGATTNIRQPSNKLD